MNKYKIEFDKNAVKFLSKQSQSNKERIFNAIARLPFEGNIKAMQGYAGYYRLRVGDYRIIYTVNNEILIIRIIRIGNRGDIYKNV